MLTHIKIGTEIAFTRDRSSKLTIWLSVPLATVEPSPDLRLYTISIRSLIHNAIWAGKVHSFHGLHIVSWCQIGHRIGRENRYEFVWLWFLCTQPHLTTPRSRSLCQHLRLSEDDVESLHKLSKCCLGWCPCNHVSLWLDNCWNLQFSSPILHISLTEVGGCMPQSRLGQFVKPLLLLPKSLHAVLYCFGDPAHHPAWFVIVTQHDKLCIVFSIFFVIPILRIVRTCKITQTVSDSNEHLSKRFSRRSSCCSRVSAVLISSWICIIAVSASWTHFLATEVSLLT